MSFRTPFLTPFTSMLAVTALATMLMVGGCPVEQVPTTPTTDDADNGDSTSTPVVNNQRDRNRPIPPVPVDDTDNVDGGGGGSTGGGDADPPDFGETVSPPITINITAPAGADINILGGRESTMSYEVFGGDPADGAITVDLFFDADGNRDTGDETLLRQGLPVRGTENFSTDGIAPGRYFLGLRAFNRSETTTTYATGALVVVGEAAIEFDQPAADMNIRPGSGVTVAGTIDSLARTLSWSVFLDVDTTFNGNEIEQFTGGGTNVNGTAFTEGLAAGTYFIGMSVDDSVGNPTKTVYFRENGTPREIRLNESPTITVAQPATAMTIRQPTDITIVANASDPEGNATVTLFRDRNGAFNGDEFALATFQLTQAQELFQTTINTGPLQPGGYRFGAFVTDGIGSPVAAYAPGAITIPGPPSVEIQVVNLNDEVTVRPGTNVQFTFVVADSQNVLASQPTGLKVDVYRDDDSNGAPDGDAILTSSDPNFRIGQNTLPINSQLLANAGLTDGFGRFIVEVTANERNGNQVKQMAAGSIVVDAVPPVIEVTDPATDIDVNRDLQTLPFTVVPTDNSETQVTVLLDPDLNPQNQNEFLLAIGTVPQGGQFEEAGLSIVDIPPGEYFLMVVAIDGVDNDPQTFYAPNLPSGSGPGFDYTEVAVSNRLIGNVDVSDFANRSDTALLRGFKPGDLAGSTIRGVPDYNFDGTGELLVGARYGKAHNVNLGVDANDQGVGFGEAYLVYGQRDRITGSQSLNAAGAGLDGLLFSGIRTVLSSITSADGRPNRASTEGLADVTVVDDMDGDELPELVFSFPRSESISLQMRDSRVHPADIWPTEPNTGRLEYNAFYPSNMPTWHPGEAQFTRGGIVIVSSHNRNLQEPELLNRRFNREIDLHEVGQIFTNMNNARFQPYIRSIEPDMGAACANCDPDVIDPDSLECTEGCELCDNIPDNVNESPQQNWIVRWDAVFDNQPPGGFTQWWTRFPIGDADFPLSSPIQWPWMSIGDISMSLYPIPDGMPLTPCDFEVDDIACNFTNAWFDWSDQGGSCMGAFPMGRPAADTVNGNSVCVTDSWATGFDMDQNMSPDPFWTGFYPPTTQVLDFTVGARILGQNQFDRFGSEISHDGTWLYIASPEHTAIPQDVPGLQSNRPRAGVVYQLRTNLGGSGGGLTRLQLWQEPGRSWPRPDQEQVQRIDFTIPTPHQYIIETVGSLRGQYIGAPADYTPPPITQGIAPDSTCPPAFDAGTGGQDALWAFNYVPRNTSSVATWVDNTPQIVGPHEGSRIGHVRALGDVNGDGINDFAVGSSSVRSVFGNPGSDVVGGIFIVFARSPSGVGDGYRLEEMASPAQANFDGVWIRGTTTGANRLARAVSPAGDFNGDDFDDVIVGDPANDRAMLILGAGNLQSVDGGSTYEQLIADGRAIGFTGVTGDLTGFNVSNAGDVDGDGNDDVLIAAPSADPGGRIDAGKVYLVYGSRNYIGGVEYDLDSIAGSLALPSVVFEGRAENDQLGGGMAVRSLFNGGIPEGFPVGSYGQGLAALGDLDGDGLDDVAISAMLADPQNKQDAGEVYVFYGRGRDGGGPNPR